jgi:hypothetical protein
MALAVASIFRPAPAKWGFAFVGVVFTAMLLWGCAALGQFRLTRFRCPRCCKRFGVFSRCLNCKLPVGAENEWSGTKLKWGEKI